jgi:hypothetical protein
MKRDVRLPLGIGHEKMPRTELFWVAAASFATTLVTTATFLFDGNADE